MLDVNQFADKIVGGVSGVKAHHFVGPEGILSSEFEMPMRHLIVGFGVAGGCCGGL